MGFGIGKLLSDTFLNKGLDVVKKLVKDKDLAEKLEHELKLNAATQENQIDNALIADRQDARAMYKDDDKLQKAFAIIFLVGYIAVSFLVMYGAYEMTVNEMEFNGEAIAMITMLFTAMSNKINTIVDFLFGGSKGK